MSRFPGHIIKLPANTPSQSSAPGVWTLKDQLVAQRNNQWPFQRDPDFRYTTLLLQGNVPNTTGPQAMNLPLAYNSDASSNNFLITPNGDVHPKPFSPYMGSNYSVFFDGSSSFLSLADNAAFNFGTGDATVEFWFNSNGTSNNYPGIISSINYATSGAASIRFDNTGYKGKVFMYLNGGGDPVIASASTVPYNTWAHVALVRQGTSLKLYLNGSLDNSVTISAALGWYLSNGGMRIGRGFDVDGAGGYFPGYISNLRLVKGTAVYTSNFTPPTTPLQNIPGTSLLVCQSNRFIDSGTANSGSGFTITANGTPRVTDNSPFVSADFTTGSGYFDGNGDYLSLASTNSALPTGTQDYSVEAWFYWGTQTASFPQIITNPATDGFQIAYDVAAGTLSIGRYGVSPVVSYTVAQTSLANQWTHVVATRSGNTHRLFINGVLRANGVNAVSFAALTTQTIGSAGAGNYFVGYMSDVRSVLGSIPTAYQTSSTTNGTTVFTPPTSLLPVVSGTSLLTLQTRAPSQNHGFIDSSPNEFIVTRNGNVSQGTFSPFSPTGWSNYFNGSASLQTASSSSLTFGTGDFSISFWIYPTVSTAGTNTGVMGIGAAVNGTLLIYTKFPGFSDNTITIPVYGGGSVGSSIPLNVNQWNHVAISRASGTLSIYINGTRGANSPLTDNLTGSIASIGKPYYSLSVESYTGYLADVRFVKGTALYSGTSITVPTSPSTLVAGTALLTSQYNRFYDGSGITSSFTIAGSPSVQAFSPFAPANSVSPLVTGGSGYFPSSATLTIPSAPALNLVGDFCMEGWAYPTATGFTFAWKYTGGNVGASEYWWVIDGTNQLSIALDGGGGEDYFRTAANTITLNAWNHCVLTRVGNEVRQFINGVLQSYNTTGRTLNATSTTFQANGTLGYTSGFRIMKGSIPSAYQTTATTTGTTVFTPPTAPPVATQNTSLLLNFTGGGIVDATGKNVIETVGNSSVQTSQAKWSPGSMYFDGTTDYLKAPTSELWNLGSGDFAVEFFIRFISIGATNNAIVGKWGSGAGSYAWIIQINSSQLTFYTGNSGTLGTQLTFSWAPSTNVWYFVAVSRTSGNVRAYVDTNQIGTTQPNSHTLSSTSGLCAIGENLDFGGQSQFINGYLDDLRITRGHNRGYSGSTIIVPTGPFPRG